MLDHSIIINGARLINIGLISVSFLENEAKD